MSSTVTNYSQNINVAYPIPGVDNDTQGFRDNFTNIKNALTVAGNELNELMLTSVKTTGADFSYNELSRVKLKSSSWTAAIGETLTTNTNVIVSFLNGNYQKFEVAGDVGFTVTDWPTGNTYAPILIELVKSNDTATRTVEFPGANVRKPIALREPYILTTETIEKPVIFELWSADGGGTVYVKNVVDTGSNMTPFMWDPTTGSTGSVASALYANASSVAATVSNPSQPNITSLGTLTEVKIGSSVITYSNNNLIVEGAGNIAFKETSSVSSTITGQSGPSGFVSTFTLSSLTGIELGSTFKLNGNSNTFVVEGINTLTNQITVDPISMSSFTTTTSVTFTKGILANSVYFSSGQPASSIGKSGDKKGALFVNDSSINFCYADYNGSTPVWNSISTALLNNATRYTNVAPITLFGLPGDKKGTIFATTSVVYYCFQDYVGPSTACWGKITMDTVPTPLDRLISGSREVTIDSTGKLSFDSGTAQIYTPDDLTITATDNLALSVTGGSMSLTSSNSINLTPSTSGNVTIGNTAFWTFNHSNQSLTTPGYVKMTPTTVGGLGSAVTAGVGARWFVVDSSVNTFGATVTGGGSFKVPVYSDGSSWLVG